MTSTNRNHGAGVWREAAQSGGAPTIAQQYLVKSGSDVVVDDAGPEEIVMYDVSGNGDYKSIDITVPYFLVDDGSGNLSPSTTGPADAIITDDGSGNLSVTTDLTASVDADVRVDTGGNLWIIPRANQRLYLADVRGNLGFF